MTVNDISMNAIGLLAENAPEIASVRAWHTYVAAVGREAAIANSYPAAEAKRLLAGESVPAEEQGRVSHAAGEIVSDVPACSIPWLLEAEAIREVTP